MKIGSGVPELEDPEKWHFPLKVFIALTTVLRYCADCDVIVTLVLKRFFTLVIVIRRHRWQAISPLTIDVTVPRSVCLSVCLSRSCIVLKVQTAEDIDTISFACDFLYATSLPDCVKIWLTSVNPFLANFCPKESDLSDLLI